MNKLKPIEPGCLAMIIKSYAGNEGLIVTPVKCLGIIKYGDGSRSLSWEIDVFIKDALGFYGNEIAESQLMRIDGFEEDSEQIEFNELENIE